MNLPSKSESSLKDTGPDPVPESNSDVFERHERLFIALFIFLIVLGSFQRWGRDRSDFHPITIERGEDSLSMGPVDWSQPLEPQPLQPKDLNKVGQSDLLALPGIGPVLANSILEARKRKAGFGSIEDLLEVSGIGPRRLETLRPYLFLDEETMPPETPRSSPPVRSKHPGGGREIEKVPITSNSVKPHLNELTMEGLQAFPGIGEVFAERLLEKREELGGFTSWDEVGSISGVGPKRLENLQKHARLR